jgi:hypothetical protein
MSGGPGGNPNTIHFAVQKIYAPDDTELCDLRLDVAWFLSPGAAWSRIGPALVAAKDGMTSNGDGAAGEGGAQG